MTCKKVLMRSLVLMTLLTVSICGNSQDPQRFQKDIDDLHLKYDGKVSSNDLTVFTGSSSIRMWQNVGDYFPGKNIINTGFGGSQMSDLIYYSEQAITRYKPSQVFIYEGDNDLATGKSAEQVIQDARTLIGKIRKELPGCRIVIIAAKPSPSRWNLRDEYLRLNSLFKSLTTEYGNLGFADVWNPVLNSRGVPRSDIFLPDSLHMNKTGYDIWGEVIEKIIK